MSFRSHIAHAIKKDQIKNETCQERDKMSCKILFRNSYFFLPRVWKVFWRKASLLHHHALVVPWRPCLPVRRHARLTRRVGQLLRPLQRLHQVWVGPLCRVARRVGVRLRRVRGPAGASVAVRQHVRRRDTSLLHAGVHGAGVVHVARHDMRG